jgi:transmembrane sensor
MDKGMGGPGNEGPRKETSNGGGSEPVGSSPPDPFGSDAGSGRVGDEATLEGTDGRSTVDNLIIQVLNGTASRFDEERLRRWREATTENEEQFQEMVQVWKVTEPEPVIPASGPPSVEDILSAASIPLPSKGSSAGSPGVRSGWNWLTWGFLAAAIAAVGLGVRVIPTLGPHPIRVHQAATEGSQMLTLEDGSFVRLAAGSTLREWESETEREFSLQGRAFFAVARDETRPFVVRAGSGEVRVLGTRFQVETDRDRVETVVVEGLVRVTNANGSVDVGAGNRAHMTDAGEPLTEAVDDVFAWLNWPEGTLLFHATPLGQVVEEVSRHFGRRISIESADLSQRRVTAWFQGETFDAVAESLCLVTESKCTVVGENVTMGMGGTGG